jgi:HEAT repeat protein
MRSKKPIKNTSPSKPSRLPRSRSLIRSEWPLLLYPVLVGAAIATLYIANRPVSSKPLPVDQAQIETHASKTEGQASQTPGRKMEGEKQGLSDSGRDAKPQPTAVAPVAASAPSAVSPVKGETSSPGRTLGQLRRAVQTNDHAAIKDCLDRLVAWGDQGVGLLSELVARGTDGSCVWAAEALARIGTPVATQALLNALSSTENEVLKEQIAKRAATISNHDSWPVLLDALQTADDPVVRRAASASLSRMADGPVVDELVARYDAAGTIDEAADLAHTVGNIISSKAAPSLLALAKQIPIPPDDSLDQSILGAVANVGDPQCVSYLLRKLEASDPGQDAYLMNLISQISQPQAQASLLYAAVGNKEVSAERGRTAAVMALKNYPNEQSYVLLEQIASTERNAVLASAASRTLDDIRQASPMLAANAQVRLGEQILLPFNPVRK